MSRALTLSLAELAALIRQRAGTIALVALLVMGSALAVGYGSELVFVARGQIFLGEASDAAAEDDSSPSDSDGISGELAILAGASLLERATLAAGLNASIGPARGRAPRYSEWLSAGRDYAALPRADNELSITGATIAGARAREYMVQLISAERFRVWSGPALLGEGRLGEPWSAGDVAWTLRGGRARQPSAGARYEVVVTPVPLAALEAGERLRVSAPRVHGSPHYGRIVTLEFTAGSPERAERFLTALLDAYVQHRHDRKVGKQLAREAQLDDELRSVERAIDGVERRLASLRASRRALWLGAEDNPWFAERERYQAAESRSLLEVARLSVYRQSFAGPAPPLASFLDGESNDAQLAALGADLADAERGFTEAQQAFADGALELREHALRVADRQRAIGQYVESRLGRARERQRALGHVLAEQDQKLASFDAAQRELAELTRDHAAHAETYARLLAQKSEASLGIAKAVSKDRVIDPPRSVAEPASPNLPEALSSGLFGLLLGVLGVLFRRLTADSVQAEADARRLLGGVPVIASVPARASSTHSPFEEAFRSLALSLCGAPPHARARLVFVTSPTSGDGKTTCAFALGLALARRGRRVLLVEGAAPPRFGQRPDVAPGLEDVIAGRTSFAAACSKLQAGAGELQRLGAGSVQPHAASAGAERLAEFFETARSAFDAVIVDAPAHVSSNVLAALGFADRVLCVVRLRHTPRRALAELLATLPLARAAALVVDDRTRWRRARASRGVVAFGEGGPVVSG